MTMIQVKCIDQVLTVTNSPVIASGGVLEDTVEFEFCPKWDGFAKVAVFYQNKGAIYYSLIDSNNHAIVPREAIATKGTMFFGVIGVKDNVTRTSEVLRYRIDTGALDGFTVEEPTPELYQQVLQMCQYMQDKANELTAQQSAFETDINQQMAVFKEDVEADINARLAKVYRPKGSVANFESLPTDAAEGDVYNTLDNGKNYAWTGTAWDDLGGIVDLTSYYTKTEVNELLQGASGEAVHVMDEASYVEVADRKKGHLYFNVTDRTVAGSEEIEVSPNMGLKVMG